MRAVILLSFQFLGFVVVFFLVHNCFLTLGWNAETFSHTLPTVFLEGEVFY